MPNLQVTITNLEKIYVELPLLADEVKTIREEFDMLEYGCYDHNTIDNSVCRAYGCGLGNASRLFDLNKKEYYVYDEEFDYELFSDSILPSLKDMNIGDILWRYLFSYVWGQHHSNYRTFDHFIERVAQVITLLKEKGVVEVTFDPEVSNKLTVIQ